MVVVPFVGEEQEHVALCHLCGTKVSRLEDAAAVGDVDKLVLVEHASSSRLKRILLRVALGWIRVAGCNMLIAHCADGQSPTGILLVAEQIDRCSLCGHL